MKDRPVIDMPSTKGLKGNMLALCIGLIITVFLLLVIETSLRFHYKGPGKFFYSLSPELVNHTGIFKRSQIPHAGDPAPRVFCLGGSTTNGCNMPIHKSYPNLLHAIFGHIGRSGSAYNFGISGVNSVTTNYFIKNLLPRYNPSCVVIHDGYNDLPVVIKKLGEDNYTYIRPDYHKPYNPHIKNPILRYIISSIKFNFRSIRRFLVTFVSNKLHRGGDLFLGFDYKKHKLVEGTSADIYAENDKRMNIMIESELDSIDYCLRNGIKVIVILEPHIKPLHFEWRFGSGFRDKDVGEILSECHKKQQALYMMALAQRYRGQKDVIIMDMRDFFKERYEELFYDECHLNGKGNFIKARLIYSAVNKLFPALPKTVKEAADE